MPDRSVISKLLSFVYNGLYLMDSETSIIVMYIVESIPVLMELFLIFEIIPRLSEAYFDLLNHTSTCGTKP